MGVFAGTGVALASPCASQDVVSPFSQLGDPSSYFLAPGGSFEGSPAALGWKLTQAGVIDGNESSYVGSPDDSKSLEIEAGGSATSPTICLDRTMPYFRFFARQLSPGGDLKVSLKLGAANSHAPAFKVIDLANGSTPDWTPVGRVWLLSGLLPKGLSVQNSLQFQVTGSTGSWAIDDVYVDPYRVN